MLTPTRLEGDPVRPGHALERLEEAQAGAHGALGVVLVHGGHAEDADHGVADELLDRAAVGLDHLRARGVKYSAQEGVDVLRVGGLAHRREADEVAEEGGDDPALLGARARRSERSRALAAELEPIRLLDAATGAGYHRFRPPALTPGPRHRIRFPFGTATLILLWGSHVRKVIDEIPCQRLSPAAGLHLHERRPLHLHFVRRSSRARASG